MPVPLRFAAIADDLTGGSDLAGMLHEGGLAAVQFFCLPDAAELSAVSQLAGAIVVSLKTRSIPAEEAVSLSLEACRRLQALEPCQLQFKYCSTFDSTAAGNIGPVTGALMSEMGVSFTVAVPALPVNGRTQYLGHLFVNGRLLAESPMRQHPLNPMDDSDLTRFLSRQTSRRIGLVILPKVLEGPGVLQEELESLRAKGVEIALVDAVRQEDLGVITEACAGLKLITGGSGFGRYLGGGHAFTPRTVKVADGPVLAIAGSCSAATLEQLARFERQGGRVARVSRPEEIRSCRDVWRGELEARGVLVVASSAPPDRRLPDNAYGFEDSFAELAAEALEQWGVRSLIVAGGETSGAVIQRAGIRCGQVAGIVAPGVPALASSGLFFVLKSGNFGGPDFFADVLELRRRLISD